MKQDIYTKQELLELVKGATTTPECPKCGTRFDEMPKSQKTCPNCEVKNYIYKHYLLDEKALIPEEQQEEYKTEKKEYHTAKKYLIGGLQGIAGYSERDREWKNLVKQAKKQLKKKFNKTPSLPDIGWEMANKLATELTSKGDHAGLSQTYHCMAQFQHRIGKPSQQLQAQRRLANLRNVKNKSNIKNTITIRATRDACEECKKIDGNTYSVKKIFETPPLPCSDCMFKLDEDAVDGWCRCRYDYQVSL